MASMVVTVQRIAIRCATVLVAVVTGCGDGGHLPAGQTWSSGHFRYSANADDAGACAGVVDQLEAHFAMMHAYLGIEWPGGTIDYYKYRDAADLDDNSGCAEIASACANGEAVYSPLVLDRHELIHVYTRHLGRPPPMFEEGLAEALAAQGRVFVAPRQTWQEVLHAPRVAGGVPPTIAYWAGGWFVTYLLRHHDVRTFVAFYSAVRADAGEADVAAAFQQVYGVPLDDEWQRARDEAPDEKGMPIWECAGESLALGGAAADLSDRCDGRGAFATFELAAETSLVWYDVALSSGFNLASCASDSELHVAQIGWTGALETGAVDLPAGRYYVAPMTGSGTLGLRSAANAVATSCADAAPLLLPAGARNLTLAIANGSDARYVKLHHADKLTFELARQWDDPIVPDVMAATVEICADCSSPCAAFDNSVATTVADGQLLRLSGLNAPQGAIVSRFYYQ